jgi:hypothetical protein
MITSSIDFALIRTLVADCYSENEPPCYDPPSLFLVDLFRHIHGCQNMNTFLELVRDKDRGRVYRNNDLTLLSLNHSIEKKNYVAIKSTGRNRDKKLCSVSERTNNVSV